MKLAGLDGIVAVPDALCGHGGLTGPSFALRSFGANHSWGSVVESRDGRPITAQVRGLGFSFNANGDHEQTIDSVYEQLPEWCGLAARWIEVSTGQDMRPQPEPETFYVGGTFWFANDNDQWAETGRGRTWPLAIRPTLALDLSAWKKVVALASRDERPETAHSLLADASVAFQRKDYRVAVMEAGAAAELALRRMLTGIGYVLRPRMTLGNLVDVAVARIGAPRVPADVKTMLLRPRNEVVHRAATPNRQIATAALDVARQLVGEACPLPTELDIASRRQASR